VTSGEPDAASLGDLLPDFDADLSAAEARALLAPALSRLTEREQLIVRLRFVEDLTQAEIGERIGVTQMQVSRLLGGILAKLREAIVPAA
jgi:RNA polymerase sigma-B factor